MIRWPVTVTFRDGAAVDVVCDQYAVAMFGRWAHKTGFKSDMQNMNPTEQITGLRVMAWAELQRDAKVKQSFDVWDATVAEVASQKDEGAEVVDPTLTATSVG